MTVVLQLGVALNGEPSENCDIVGHLEFGSRRYALEYKRAQDYRVAYCSVCICERFEEKSMVFRVLLC